jgi:toxin-antitoxin system PIN domain toxin
LLDANVWLALAVSTHQHHALARTWFDGQADDSCAFCRVTQMALLRHLTNPAIMRTVVQSQADAWRTYEAFCQDARVIVTREPAKTALYWKEWTLAAAGSYRNWTDRYLAAFAAAGGMRFVTFDQDFQSLRATDLMTVDQAAFNLNLLQ